MDQPEVLVIGAGAAGLAAARTLTRAGLSVVILEGRLRPGGRIHTLHDPLYPVPVELGAEFIHGKPPEIWRLVQSGRLSALELNAGQWTIHNGTPHSDGDFFGDIGGVLESMKDAPEQSFRDFIANSGAPPDQRYWATRYVEGFNAARQERISVRALALQEEVSHAIEGDRTFRPVRGFSALVEWLLDGAEPDRLRIHYGAAVESVAWRHGYVEISARAFGRPLRLYAPRAIVTVPLGVLQAGAIRFEPEPPTLCQACSAMEMGHAARITLRFRRPVWEDRAEFDNLGFLFSQEDWMPTWWTALPVRAPVITGWTGGPAAEEHAGQDPADWLAPSLRSLARLLHTDETSLVAELETWHAHNWSADPFCRGAYSYIKAGGMEAQARFGDPVEGTLYFAGEAVHAEGHWGTVHGAIASGDRAARQILKA